MQEGEFDTIKIEREGEGMATSQEFCESVIEAFSIAGTIRVRAMMGEYCVYYNDKLISDCVTDNVCSNVHRHRMHCSKADRLVIRMKVRNN